MTARQLSGLLVGRTQTSWLPATGVLPFALMSPECDDNSTNSQAPAALSSRDFAPEAHVLEGGQGGCCQLPRAFSSSQGHARFWRAAWAGDPATAPARSLGPGVGRRSPALCWPLVTYPVHASPAMWTLNSNSASKRYAGGSRAPHVTPLRKLPHTRTGWPGAVARARGFSRVPRPAALSVDSCLKRPFHRSRN